MTDCAKPVQDSLDTRDPGRNPSDRDYLKMRIEAAVSCKIRSLVATKLLDKKGCWPVNIS